MIKTGVLRWRCPPNVAAVQVAAIAWTFAPPVIAYDLHPANEFHKVVRVWLADSERHLVDVQCTSDRAGHTVLDLLLADDLDSFEVGHAQDFFARVVTAGEDEGLNHRPMGFGR